MFPPVRMSIYGFYRSTGDITIKEETLSPMCRDGRPGSANNPNRHTTNNNIQREHYRKSCNYNFIVVDVN